MDNKKLITNLCIIRDGSKILLGRKTRKIGAGFFNGPGGKVDEGETIEESTKREVEEEVGLKVDNLQKVGKIIFKHQDGSGDILMHIFLTTTFEGEICDSEQMVEVQWFEITDLPFNQMIPDDKYWLPKILEGKKIEAEFIFDHQPTSENLAEVVSYELNVVSEIREEIVEGPKTPWQIK